MKNKKLVSVSILCYNHEKYVAQAIESVLTQTYQNIELVIVDNNSSDKSKEIIETYVKKDNRIKFYPLKINMFPSGGSNFGISKCNGEYIALLSADDYFDLTKIELQLAHMQNNDLTNSFTWVNIVDDNSNFLSEHFLKKIFNRPFSRKELKASLVKHGNSLCATSFMFHKTLINKYGYFDNRLLQLQDYDMWLRIIKHDDINLIPHQLTNYRVRDDMQNLSLKKADEVLLRTSFEHLIVVKNILALDLNILSETIGKLCTVNNKYINLFNYYKENQKIDFANGVLFEMYNLVGSDFNFPSEIYEHFLNIYSKHDLFNILKINDYAQQLHNKNLEMNDFMQQLEMKEQQLHSKNLEIIRLLELSQSLRLKSRLKASIKKLLPSIAVKLIKKLKQNSLNDLFIQKIKNKNIDKMIKKKEVASFYKKRIIVVSHDANKQGAPLLALNIVKHLNKFFNYDVVTILVNGGDLQNDFEEYSYVYRFDVLSEKEKHVILKNLYSNKFRLSICNTSVVGDVVEILKNNNIESISLIHELPYVIKVAGLETSMKKIIQNTNRIIFPSNYVRNKLSNMFQFDESKIGISHQGRYMQNLYKFDKPLAKQKLCNKLNIDNNSNIIINIGRGEYRKGFDLFIDTALEVLKRLENTYFVWVGKCDDEDYNNAIEKIKRSNFSNNIKFIDFEKDIGLYYSGSDLFYLSSREDPFPSVFIDAVSVSLPVIAYDDGGGFTDYMRQIDGKLIKNFDTKDTSQFIIDFFINKEIRAQYESKFINLANDFGFNQYLQNILEIAGENHPKVSVIVPNYNYERYIQMRLESIFNQTVKPFEIIFLDDNSKDNSLSIAQELLEKSGFDYKIISNKTNHGCYNQWLKGIQEAKGDYIWIAEADDLCEMNFVEELVKKFEDKNISLAYAQSIAIDENSNEMDFSYVEYTKELSHDRWLNDFTNNGKDEIVNYLVKLNTIPNASGVMMRKSALENIDKYITKYTSTGDWFVYIYALQHGNIAFSSKKLNYHRRHSNSIIHTVMYNPKLLKEIVLISKYTLENFDIKSSDIALLVKRFQDYYSLLPDKKNTLSMDNEFKIYFQEIKFEYFWTEYIEK